MHAVATDTDTDDEDANQEGDSDFLKTYKELTRGLYQLTQLYMQGVYFSCCLYTLAEESCSPIQPDPRKAQGIFCQ